MSGWIRIIDLHEDVDLRTVSWLGPNVFKMAKQAKLKTGQAICCINKKRDRFRLITQPNGAIHVSMPALRNTADISLQLQISEGLAALAGNKRTRTRFDTLVGVFEDRSDRYKLRLRREAREKKRAKKR